MVVFRIDRDKLTSGIKLRGNNVFVGFEGHLPQVPAPIGLNRSVGVFYSELMYASNSLRSNLTLLPIRFGLIGRGVPDPRLI